MTSLKSMQASPPEENPEDILDADDAAEEIWPEDDHPMEDEEEGEGEDDTADGLQEEEIELQNDSSAHMDSHTDSVFCLAQHPLIRSLIASGGGDDCAYLFDSSIGEGELRPVFPRSYESKPTEKFDRPSIPPLQRLDGHSDSVSAIAFTQTSGDYLVTAGLDGKLRAWSSSLSPSSSVPTYTFLAEAAEVQEINWLSPCPSPSHPNVVALGASDGSVWVYTIDSKDTASPLSISQAYYLHTESCTAGSWTPDGKLLATVSEDSSLYVYDVWGEAATAGVSSPTVGSGQAIISLTASDQRFGVEGGLYSIAISPGGTIAAVGGAGGQVRIISLPRLDSASSRPTSLNLSTTKSRKDKPTTVRGSKIPPSWSPSPSPSSSSTTVAQAGTLLASLTSQTDSVESLSFSRPPLTLLASGSVDGTIALFDVAHRFALRRLIRDAHDGFALVQLEFLPAPTDPHATAGKGHYLTSAGMDGVIKQWDGRRSTAVSGPSHPSSTTTTSTSSTSSTMTTAAAASENTTDLGPDRDQGLVRQWRGHRGDGEGGGVLAFVQSERDGDRIVSAGDDGVVLVFSDPELK